VIHDEELARGVTGVLGASRITVLERLSGGASRETWRLVADGEELILQRLRRGAVTRIDLEVGALRLAAEHGVPVPRIVVDGSASDALERPFVIVRRIDGETIARKLLRDDEFARARAALPAQIAAAAARIHSVPIDSLGAMSRDDQVESMRSLLDALGNPHPAFEVALRWLDLHRPAPRPTVLVHGDLRLGNLIVDGDGLRGVLDWELSHLGSAAEDLGWMCVRAWRFGSPLPAAGVCGRSELLRHYRAAGGDDVSPDELRWWEVLGTLKWGLICIMQSQTHLNGLVHSHELAILGRRACENEWDLLNLLCAS
jgi:aminoglycoside phosphotransferase (APT) family kinase protein